MGNRYDEGYGLHTLGWIYAALGRYGEAEAALKSAAALLREVRAPLGVAFCPCGSGRVTDGSRAYMPKPARRIRGPITTVTAANPEMYDAYPLLHKLGPALLSSAV